MKKIILLLTILFASIKLFGQEVSTKISNTKLYIETIQRFMGFSPLAEPIKLIIEKDDIINAAASYFNDNWSLIYLSKGAIAKLTQKEINAVVTHELTHLAYSRLDSQSHPIKKILNKIPCILEYYPCYMLHQQRNKRREELCCDKMTTNFNLDNDMISALLKIKIDINDLINTEIQNPKTANNIIFFLESKPISLLFSHPSYTTRIFNIKYQQKKPEERTVLDKIKKKIFVDWLCI